MRLAILSLPLILANFGWAEDLVEYLLPTFTLSDSVSVREWGPYGFPSEIYRDDYLVRSRDGNGRITRLDDVFSSNTETDSTVNLFEWTLSIPFYGAKNPFFSETWTRTIREDFQNGIFIGTDTFWSSWYPTQKALVMTASDQFGGCRWNDSIALDAYDRVLSQYDCEADSLNDSTVVPLYFVLNAQYTNTSDTVPSREVSRDSSIGVISFEDTVSVWGNPNRPDSLFEGGMDGDLVQRLIRDPSGRLVEISEYDPGSSQVVGTELFTYDSQGRLILDIKPGTPGDTTQYLYAWSDATTLRSRSSELRGFRIVGQNIEVNFPVSDRVRVDQLDLSGRVVAKIADKIFPAGKSTISLPSTSMGILRLRSSQGESVLLEPPR